VISPTQRPLPDNTQHSQGTDIYATSGIRTHDPSKRVTADPRLRPRVHWNFPLIILYYIFPSHKTNFPPENVPPPKSRRVLTPEGPRILNPHKYLAIIRCDLSLAASYEAGNTIIKSIISLPLSHVNWLTPCSEFLFRNVIVIQPGNKNPSSKRTPKLCYSVRKPAPGHCTEPHKRIL
jgi:hypothetical protein